MKWYDNNTVVIWPVIIIVLLMLNLSCQKQVVIHPIEKSDILFIPKNAIVHPDPNSTVVITIEKDGWFLSEVYVQEVMEAKID